MKFHHLSPKDDLAHFSYAPQVLSILGSISYKTNASFANKNY